MTSIQYAGEMQREHRLRKLLVRIRLAGIKQIPSNYNISMGA